MKICIISDRHANLEALEALPDDYDELWVLGDLVNYGPDPVAIIDFVRSDASTVIRARVPFASGCDAVRKSSSRLGPPRRPSCWAACFFLEDGGGIVGVGWIVYSASAT